MNDVGFLSIQHLLFIIHGFYFIVHRSYFIVLWRGVRREAAFEFVWDGHGVERVAADGDEDEVGFGDDGRIAVASHFKIQTQRFRADAPDIDGDFEQIVQLGGLPEVAFEMRTRQPHVEFVEHSTVRQTDRAEKLRLGYLEKTYVRAVKDDARRVHIAPTDAFLYAKLPRFRLCLAHRFIQSTTHRESDAPAREVN
jgi:hypothetical protein